MKYNPQIHHRRSIRLKAYDYSQAGMYFVTLIIKNRECLLGEILENEVKLSRIGDIVKKCWEEIPSHFPNAELDRYVVMPNHFHGILVLKEELPRVQPEDPVRVEYIQPQRGKIHRFQHVVPKSVGSIIRSFKAAVTRDCRNVEHAQFEWQRDFYDHIIRDGENVAAIRKYILENPAKWTDDENHPGNTGMDGHRESDEEWLAYH